MIDLSQPPQRRAERIVLLTMSRDWMRDQARADLTHETLALIHGRWPDALLVHGDEPLGDQRAAELWVEISGNPDQVEPVPSEWDLCTPRCPRHRRWTTYPHGHTYCPTAGLRRNTRMVTWVARQRSVGAVAICLAFVLNGSAGASDCLARARRAQIPTHPVHAWASRPRTSAHRHAA